MKQKLFFLLAILLATGILNCARPVGVRPASEKAVYRQLTESALSGENPSSFSMQLLARLGLDERFRKNPKDALAELHAGLGNPDEHDRLFGLAELSYLHARQARAPQYYLAAAVYAYIFLFPEDHAQAPAPYDPRLRLAMNLYNRAIINGLRSPNGDKIDLSPRQLTLPFGQLDLAAKPIQSRYEGFHFTEFSSVEDYKIHGLRNHYRKPGIGASLAAWSRPEKTKPASRWLRPGVKVPMTAFVRFAQPRKELDGGKLTGRIELYDVNVTPQVDLGGRLLPLESDPSAALAYSLNYSQLWDFEIAGFRRGDFSLAGAQSEGDLFFSQPYCPGRIPVVFVHGTATSPARWAEMFNECLGDPLLASRFQFWFFIYNSGNPIALSAMRLREDLQTAVAELDPEGKDPALREMVVVGHSQGGLLTKLTAVSSGTRFWNIISKEPFENAKLSSETRTLLKQSLFMEPLPFVKRVVFIATPHNGCYLVEGTVGKIARRLVTLPATLTRTSMEVVKLNPARAAQLAFRLPTAIDNMNPDNPYLCTLASLPMAPGVPAHSIIAVRGNGPPDKGKDGVVSYAGAHIPGVESEYIVDAGHSCQSSPGTIEEVRRILYKHVGVEIVQPASMAGTW